MKKSELAHILRAACSITGGPNILVIGSQSILASFSEDELPVEATRSIEADVAFVDDADEPVRPSTSDDRHTVAGRSRDRCEGRR
jgi:hypothetical protein